MQKTFFPPEGSASGPARVPAHPAVARRGGFKSKAAIFFLSFLVRILFSPAAFCSARSEEILGSMGELERVSQLFLVNIEGSERFSPVEREDGKSVLPGGVLLFAYNIADSYEGVKAFCASIKEYYKAEGRAAPFIALDQEGGAVSRLRKIRPAGQDLPSQSFVAENLTLSEAKALYVREGRTLRDIGVDVNLAPVCEAGLPFNASFLGSRSFGGFADTVAYSIACIESYENAGVACFVKHFPGNTEADPHEALPTLSLSRGEVFYDLVLPWALILRCKPCGVIMSHIRIPSVDDSAVMGSRVWIRGVLKDLTGYEGLVVSDDIYMGAVEEGERQASCVRAIKNGVDIVMISEKRFLDLAKYLLERAKSDAELAARLWEAENAVIDFKIKRGLCD